MPTKIFVGNLPPGITRDDLHMLFAEFGTITDIAVMGNYGFVHLATEQQATNAVMALNEYDLYGSQLRVELSTPATQGKLKVFDNRHSSTKIFVGNLKPGTSEQELRQLFEPYGTVTETAIVGSYGFVHLSSIDEAKAAIKDLNGFKLNGQLISVELSTKETQGKLSKYNSGNAAVHPAGGNFPEYGRPRPGMGMMPRGRGRGFGSARFDPYGGGPPGWTGPRYDPYGGSAGDSDYSYDESNLLPPPIPRRPPVVPLEHSVGGQMTDPTLDETDAGISFARDLLRLYNENPAAFDAYAKDPVVLRSLKLDVPTPDPGMGYGGGGLGAPGPVRRPGLGMTPRPPPAPYQPGLYQSFE